MRMDKAYIFRKQLVFKRAFAEIVMADDRGIFKRRVECPRQPKQLVRLMV
jgi:hypothetical protein